jgi:hypothetical protein
MDYPFKRNAIFLEVIKFTSELHFVLCFSFEGLPFQRFSLNLLEYLGLIS